MQTFVWAELTSEERKGVLSRPEAGFIPELRSTVQAILDDVRIRKDEALKDYTARFDGVELESFRVDNAALDEAVATLTKSERAAIDRAIQNVQRFHSAQLPEDITVETQPGLVCKRIAKPIESVGLYVPGGTAPLVSTVIMLALPAKIAGVKRRVLVSPAQKDGKINSGVLAAAKLCGVTEVYAVGGAQAIGALAYGTETIAPVAKIFGPGNKYVAMAKSLVSSEPGGPAIDLPAGPSEAMVIADGTSNPAFAAADLLSQAEHDMDAQVICVASSASVSYAILIEIDKQLETLPRNDIAKASLQNGRMIIAEDRIDLVNIINSYAPEHIILQNENAEKLALEIENSGSVFIGPYTPESLGDYASGTNHTLPTSGAARAYSGVTLESYFKYISIQSATREALMDIGPYVEELARMEGLTAHERAVTLRLAEAGK